MLARQQGLLPALPVAIQVGSEFAVQGIAAAKPHTEPDKREKRVKYQALQEVSIDKGQNPRQPHPGKVNRRQQRRQDQADGEKCH